MNTTHQVMEDNFDQVISAAQNLAQLMAGIDGLVGTRRKGGTQKMTENTGDSRLVTSGPMSKLAPKDSNLDKQIQSLRCYRYTRGQKETQEVYRPCSICQ